MLLKKIAILFDLYSGTKKERKKKMFCKLICLTRCMAELRGGCGSISNWDGVCPKFCICASMACSGRRVIVIINMHQRREVNTLFDNASVSQVSHEKSPENSPGALLPGCRIIQVLVFCRQALLRLPSMLPVTKSLFLFRSWG